MLFNVLGTPIVITLLLYLSHQTANGQSDQCSNITNQIHVTSDQLGNLDLYLLLDLSDSLIYNTNQLTLNMAELFLFGGLQQSWECLYQDKIRWCLLGYNDNTYILENCTNNPQFLQNYYNTNTDLDYSNDIDILDLIHPSRKSLMETAIFDTVDIIVDGEIAGDNPAETRILLTTLQFGVDRSETGICNRNRITNALELSQIHHILLQIESGNDGMIIGSQYGNIDETITPIRCLINDDNNDFLTIESYLLFDLCEIDGDAGSGMCDNSRLENGIYKAMESIAVSFVNIYDELEVKTDGYISYQTVSGNTLPKFISGSSYGLIDGILWLVSGNVTLKEKTNRPTMMPVDISGEPTEEPTEEPTPHPVVFDLSS